MKVNQQSKLEAVATEIERKPGECNILETKKKVLQKRGMINGVIYCCGVKKDEN